MIKYENYKINENVKGLITQYIGVKIYKYSIKEQYRMDLNEALNILNIKLTTENYPDLFNNTINNDPETLLKTAKHQYHKLALLFHPDKNNTPQATKEFQKINDAYEYIKSYTRVLNSDNDSKNMPHVSSHFSPKEYKQYIYQFINTIYEKTPEKQQEKFAELIAKLVNCCEKNVIPILQKYRSNHVILLNVYKVIIKYKNIFNLSLDVLNKIEEFIKNTIDVLPHTNVSDNGNQSFNIIFKPRFKDLMEGNVYYSRTYNIYIPLWALNTELCYDVIIDSGNDNYLYEIVYNCLFDTASILTTTSPEIHDINLNENSNDVCLTVLLKIEDIFNRETVVLEIDDIKIPLEIGKIKMKKNQVITLTGAGIPLYNQNDVFNIDVRGNMVIILELIL